MPAKKPPPPDSLAFLAECGRAVYIVCDRCGHCAQPDLLFIAQRVGWGAKAHELGPRLTCGDCRHRGGRFTFERPARRPVCPRCLRSYDGK